MSDPRLAVIGGGNMAQAILRGAIDTGVIKPDDVIVAEPDEAKRNLFQSWGSRAVANAAKLVDRLAPDAQIMLAVKPQFLADAAHDLGGAADGRIVITILAGSTSQRVRDALGSRAHVIRVMPNLPAAVGKGTSGVLAGPDVSDTQADHAMDMMRRTGTAVTVENEDMLDRATAVAGSGPGYVFEIARSYVAAAEKLGFDPDQARALVLGTMEGTIAMALANPDTPLEELRNSVTSKGGTTAAGLDALNRDGGRSDKLDATLTSAIDRAVELL